MQTVMSDIDEVIERLASNQDVPMRKPLSSLLGREISVSCLKMEFLNNEANSRVEISYLKGSRKSSLVGELVRHADKSLNMLFGPSINTFVIVVYTTANPVESPLDVMVLSDVDAFPKCENFLVLQRSQQSSRIVQIVSSMGANLPSNPLQEIRCEFAPSGNVIIRPIGSSSSPFSSGLTSV